MNAVVVGDVDPSDILTEELISLLDDANEASKGQFIVGTIEDENGVIIKNKKVIYQLYYKIGNETHVISGTGYTDESRIQAYLNGFIKAMEENNE